VTQSIAWRRVCFGEDRGVNEADTCRKFVVPRLQAAGWDEEPHSIAEQRSISGGRIVPVGRGFVRRPPKRVDHLLRAARGRHGNRPGRVPSGRSLGPC
jgi:hypothetical protein